MFNPQETFKPPEPVTAKLIKMCKRGCHDTISIYSSECAHFYYQNQEVACTYAADHTRISFGCVRMAALVKFFRISASPGGTWIC